MARLNGWHGKCYVGYESTSAVVIHMSLNKGSNFVFDYAFKGSIVFASIRLHLLCFPSKDALIAS